ncbi:MAG: hypothetical protein KIT16_15405 [Rhodospirillaceae bacterium]|nr:hypothetical protein [Rhodospirillaceae bacterium]
MGFSAAVAGASLAFAARAEDARTLVELPAPMQAHMLANMRDHLAALNEILAALAAGKNDAAAAVAEQRIGMSSLERHGASHMAPFMPKPMQDMGTAMHRAASRFAIVVQDAAVSPGPAATGKIFRSLADLTATCTGCHAAYRLR